jgi:hypothetical protein
MQAYEWLEEHVQYSEPRHYMNVNGQFHTIAALLWGKSRRYQLYRKLGGPQSLTGRCGKYRICLPYWEWSPESSAVQPVA